MLTYAAEIGWQSVSPTEAMQMRRGDTATLYFPDVLKAQLLKLNAGIIDDSNGIQGVSGGGRPRGVRILQRGT